jgi:glutathione S-transferase
MQLYHTAQSRSMRILWLLEELGLDYDANMLPFDARALSLADHLDVGRLGELPILIDAGVSMVESVAIVHYLINRYGDSRLAPERESDRYGAYLEWIEFGERKLMDPLSQWLQHSALLPESERNPDIAKKGRTAFEHFAAQVDAAVAEQDYLLGNTLTAADIVVGHALFLAEHYGTFPEQLAHLRAYYERLRARPAFQVAAAS